MAHGNSFESLRFLRFLLFLPESLLDEFVLQGVAGDFHVAAQAGLVPDAPDVGADGLLAQREFTGDLFDRSAQGDQAEYLQLAVGKFLVKRLRG